MTKVKSLQPIETTHAPVLQDEAQALISQAIDKNVPVETMEKLLAMRRELKEEKAKELFLESLAKLQSQMPIIEKTKVVKNSNGTIRYKYAPLEEILKQIKDLIRKNGFSYMFDSPEKEDTIEVVCTIMHEAGHSRSSAFRVKIDASAYMNTQQQYASALTYAKRYAFCNAFGILTGDEDDDTSSITPSKSTPRTQSPKLTQQQVIEAPSITPLQIDSIHMLMERKGKSQEDVEAYISAASHDKVTKIEDMNQVQANQLIQKLETLPNITLAERKKFKFSKDEEELTEKDYDDIDQAIS